MSKIFEKDDEIEALTATAFLCFSKLNVDDLEEIATYLTNYKLYLTENKGA